jgi:hypothetical protein
MMTTQPSQTERPTARPLRTVSIVIYATLALLAIAIPQSLGNWLQDMKSGEVREWLLPAAEALRVAADRTSISAPYRRGRELFLLVSGHEDE